MKLVTFNIRCDFGQDGENNFEYRKDLILKKIAQEKPDMICFQEVLPHIAKWLKENLTEYYVIGCGRSPELRDEQVSIAYRKDRLNLMEMQSYWLSETPYVPASRYAEQSICPRICNEALFEDLETGKVFRIVNTHLDHIGAQARILGLRQILEKLKTEKLYPDAATMITGDFNAEPQDPEFEILKEYPEYTNVTEHIGITYHGFTEEDHPCSIFAGEGRHQDRRACEVDRQRGQRMAVRSLSGLCGSRVKMLLGSKSILTPLIPDCSVRSA